MWSAIQIICVAVAILIYRKIPSDISKLCFAIMTSQNSHVFRCVEDALQSNGSHKNFVCEVLEDFDSDRRTSSTELYYYLQFITTIVVILFIYVLVRRKIRDKKIEEVAEKRYSPNLIVAGLYRALVGSFLEYLS